jgi:hypothetical protein
MKVMADSVSGGAHFLVYCMVKTREIEQALVSLLVRALIPLTRVLAS